VSAPLELEVEPDAAGQRLDKWLVSRVPGLGRRRAAELFASGRVTIGGRRAQKGEAACAGDRVRVELGGPEYAQPAPDAPLNVLLEAPELVVVSKPAGQASSPLSTEESGTLVNALVGRYPEMAEIGFTRREPGLLHRLDTQTSGLLVAARTTDAFERLRRAFAASAFDKRYLAIVESAGMPDSGTIDRPLAQDRRHPKRVLVCTSTEARGARRAVSRYRVLERGERFALVEVSAARAFRHQVRAHLASIGHPLVGDATYAGLQHSALGARHALHASYIAWPGDDRLPGFSVADPMPDELRSLIGG
jgi:23S rRNA pseudouridine1911/1915/1917 synthase